MSRLQRVSSAVLTLAVAGAVAAGAWWLVTHKPAVPAADKPPAAATVAKVVKEDELNTVTLTAEAETRLGLTVGAVTKKGVGRVRLYGGEVTIPVGRTILVAAPLTGTLRAPPGGVPKAGKAVAARDAVFQLLPLLTPDGKANLSASLAEASGLVDTARAQVDLARIALDRAKRVMKEGAGSQRQVDEAVGASDVAAKGLAAATARKNILQQVVGDAAAGTAAPIPIDSPEDGILRVVSAMPGQTVPAGAALFEVVDLSVVWVRVPLPVGDLDDVDRTKPAAVGSLSAAPGAKLTTAPPAPAPPSANPLAGTVDVFYELPNAAGTYIPGQRLGVTVPQTDARESLTVPWSAVVFDVNGGTWVYERTGPREVRPPAGGRGLHRRGRRGAFGRAAGRHPYRDRRRAGAVRGRDRVRQMRSVEHPAVLRRGGRIRRHVGGFQGHFEVAVRGQVQRHVP